VDDRPRVERAADHDPEDGDEVDAHGAGPYSLGCVRMSTPRESARRSRLLVLNQYYWPGFEATGHLLSELCAALADDFDVTVVAGTLRDPPTGPGIVERDGVRVERVWSTSYERRRLGLRALNYVTYLLASFQAGVTSERPDVVLCMTDPPVIADVALLVARRFRAPLVVVSQDVFPEIAVELKRLRNPLLVGALRAAIRFYLERADRVVAIGERMRDRLEEKGARPDRISVIPNWVDTTTLTPQARDNPWAVEQDLVGRFVVMHSGNVGHAQNLDALVRASTFLRDLEDLRIVIIGTGARHAELVALAELLEADHVRFLPYQPRELLPQTLSSADLHVVGLAGGLAGYVVPSRLYGVLSAARPVIVAADADSETARLVSEIEAGVVVAPGHPELLARAIRRAYDGKLDLESMGRRARAYVTQEADRAVAIGRYRELLTALSAPA
jgi:colanic acid biosynthesis glycosyl transferase WcaI